jgi:1-acyl-sn-glycerol-3-phosphate acyltransferase
LQPFQAGVMLLVRKAKCPVVPVAIAGAYRAWPRSRAVPRPWASRVRVMYGEPIPAQTLLALPAEAAVALLRARIAEMLVEMGEPVDHPIANPESREVEPAGGQPASAQP